MAIIAIVSTMAIPRLSRAAKGAGDAALAGNLEVLRGALEHYAAEHGGTYPHWNKFAAQLTTYTNDAGEAQATKAATHPWGPYLRAVPPLPVGANKGRTGVKHTDGADIGWIYDGATGEIHANCPDTEVDDAGRKYKDY